MKKLVVALSVVVLAMCANANVAPWKMSMTNLKDQDPDIPLVGAQVYVMDAKIYTQEQVYKNFSATEGAWGAADFAKVASAVFETAASGVIINKTFDYGEGGTDFDFYLVTLKSDSIYFSQVLHDLKGSTSLATQSVLFGSQNDHSKGTYSGVAPEGAGFQGAGRWSAVPEPTSALLMLLGMAGLAIRRRRA